MAASPVTFLPAADTILALKDYYAHAHACTNKLQQPIKLGLSVGQGEYRGEGTHCIWSSDLALLPSDNRITAN